MDRLEDRVRVLERQVRRYGTVNRVVNVVVGLVLSGCAAFVISNLLQLQERLKTSGTAIPGVHYHTLRVGRLEVVDSPSTRPVCVLRADGGGGGRVEVFDHRGNPLAGFDGNRGLVVRSADGTHFPATTPPR